MNYSRFVNELIGMAREQRWLVSHKGDQVLIFTPAQGGKGVRISDPRNDSHQQKIIRELLLKGGFKFDHTEKPIMANSPATVAASPPKATLPLDPLTQIQSKLTQATDLVADAVGLLASVEAAHKAEVGKLRRAVDGFKNFRDALDEV